jgi:hypothetical protein
MGIISNNIIFIKKKRDLLKIWYKIEYVIVPRLSAGKNKSLKECKNKKD